MVLEKKPVASTLREMLPKEKATFPIDQKVTVQNTISGRLDREKLEGRRWSVKTCREEGVVVVTRTA